MNEDYVSFEQAQKLKELGFDWKCNHWYHPADKLLYESGGGFYNHNESKMVCSAPTLSQAQKWLREVKEIFVYSQITSQPELKGKHYWEITSKDGNVFDSVPYSKLVDSYEQALSDGVDRALELLKQKQ